MKIGPMKIIKTQPNWIESVMQGLNIIACTMKHAKYDVLPQAH
jgi:hypothetical protein